MNTSSAPTHEEIAILAYTLWEKGNNGSPEANWFEAERLLKTKQRANPLTQEPAKPKARKGKKAAITP